MTMSTLPCLIRLETPADDTAICALHSETFGPGRFARTAFRVREGIAHDPDLSFVALDADNVVVGSVRLTPVRVGKQPVQLLGPLAVSPEHKNKGIGRMLLRTSLDAARDKGEGLVLLVGDPPYYGPFGFKGIGMGRIAFPGPVDPARVLVAELIEGAAEAAVGKVARR
jgi:predicted N-acetyltransferase YhbS